MRVDIEQLKSAILSGAKFEPSPLMAFINENKEEISANFYVPDGLSPVKAQELKDKLEGLLKSRPVVKKIEEAENQVSILLGGAFQTGGVAYHVTMPSNLAEQFVDHQMQRHESPNSTFK